MHDTTMRPAHSRRTKVYAILAGGLVLGVGTAVTLAAWNDSEFASVDFAAGTFVFQGSTDGTTFADHESEEGAAQLTFTAPFDNLSPDAVVYAPYALQLDASVAADLTSVAPVVTGSLNGDLTFAAVETTDFGCDADAFGSGTAVPTTIADGEIINLCLQVTAASSIEQGETGTAVWQWNAVSQ
ncbi:putative ribosomally synthesized peptide with SipW-like signal peptide [Microbacterium sp. ZKA21]|uniref:SipW-dependent-type signal peptide-containing protein n=1 Tax=Microbacterium sp. ZKA21 TaxID=3381694 RepID=UPI003D1DDC1B